MTLYDHDTPALDGVEKDIARLKAGCELLEEIWRAMPHCHDFPLARHPGPRGTKEQKDDYEVANRLVIKMQRHFGFDDSE